MISKGIKKSASIVLIAILLIMSLTSCAKKDEYGGIGEIDISSGEESVPETPFAKQDNPFSEYSYKTVNFDNARMMFDAPKGWNQTVVNQSCIRYDVPADDPVFPGAVFYVKCDFDTMAAISDVDEFSHVAGEFGKVMSPYITGLPYPYNEGGNVWINSYSAADETIKPTFTSDETAASIKVTKNVVLIDKVTADTFSTSGFNFVSGYFRWTDFPVMISTVVPSGWTENAKSMISYMISSAAYTDPKIAETATFSYRKLSLILPKEFKASSDQGNIFRSPYKDTRATAGMSIGIFSVPEDIGELSVDYIQSHYADSLATLLMNPESSDYYYPSVSCMEYEGEKLADESYACSAYVNIITNRYDYTAADMQYGMSSMPYMDMFVVERNGKNYMIAALYTRQQENVAMKILKAAIQSLTA